MTYPTPLLPRPLRTALACTAAAVAVGCGSFDGGESTPDASAPVTGGGTGVSSSQQLQAFSTNVFPLLRDYCADCHSGAGPGTPHIAHADAQVAYTAVVSNQKVNLNAPENSRLVRRLMADFHHCWTDCMQNGLEMQAAIQVWADLVSNGGVVGTDVDGIASGPATFADGVEAEGEERYSGGVIALWDFKEGRGLTAHDVSGVAPPMDLHLESTRWMGNYGIEFLDEGSRALARGGEARKLYDHIADPNAGTQQFSLEAWVIPDNVSQEGPARIMSFSKGTQLRNFTFGQVLYNYDFRARSLEELIDDNGQPSLSTDDDAQFAQATLQHVVLTYDQYRGRRVYVNGAWTGDSDAQGPGRLWNWDPEYAFMLGNESMRERPWEGRIQLAAVYEYALSDAQIRQNFQAGVGKRLLLRFDVGQWAGSGSYIEFVVSELDEFSYLFCEPTFVTNDPSGFRVSDLRIAVNGTIAVSGQAFANVDASIVEPRQMLSRGCSVVSKEAGPDADVFHVDFEYLAEFQNVDEEEIPPFPTRTDFGGAVPTEGLRDFARLNETMASVTGVDPDTGSVNDTFLELTQQLPPGFDLRTFSSAQQVAIAKLALEYCDGLVESPALRDAFFGTGFPFDADTTVVFADPTNRDTVIDRLVSSMIGDDVATQPARAEVAVVLNDLMDDLTLVCSTEACGPDRTRTVVKGTCAAVLSSAATTVH